jgi:uncharacterized membrane protein
MIFVGVFLMTVTSVWNTGAVSGGTVILIGPIPIILGSGPASVPLLILALIFTIISFLFFLVAGKKR